MSSRFPSFHSHLPLQLLVLPLCSLNSLLEHIQWDRLRSYVHLFMHSFVSWLVEWLNCCVVVKVITIYLYFCLKQCIPCAPHSVQCFSYIRIVVEMEFCWIETLALDFSDDNSKSRVSNLHKHWTVQLAAAPSKNASWIENRPSDRHLRIHSFLLAYIPFAIFYSLLILSLCVCVD